MQHSGSCWLQLVLVCLAVTVPVRIVELGTVWLLGRTYHTVHPDSSSADCLLTYADQMLSDAELEGFVEFGADQEEVLATQRRLKQQQRAAAAAADVEAPAAGPSDAVPGVDEETGSKRPSRRSRGAAAAREAASRQQVPDDLLPKVAIIGRPNVGKSGELLS